MIEDDGTCSLRAAVEEANAHPGRDSITVPAALEDLTVTSRILIDDDVTIDGNGATVDGGGTNGVFGTDRARVEVATLTITGGAGETYGGAIRQDRISSTSRTPSSSGTPLETSVVAWRPDSRMNSSTPS
ncbi:MAG: hypothetical protein U5R31_08435 [Acidimicrobiia bacterium]|nr:hypothetical protein [Acidimicrobiia bacterium]